MRAPRMVKANLLSGSSKIALRREDISRPMLSSEKYDSYTTAGLASVEADLKTVSATMGEFGAKPSKAKKVTLGNVSENVEYSELSDTLIEHLPSHMISLDP